MSLLSDHAREYREKLLADPYRPCYHFAAPDGNAVPGDPNGAFFADGLYHLMYLYRNDPSQSFHWGHISSRDLLHWRHHPDALTGWEGDNGCFSGGAFVDDDGTAYLTFWKFASVNGKDNGGIAIARAVPPYDVWERVEPLAVESTRWGIVDMTLNGNAEPISCADPSNIWKANGWYYMQTGNLLVLDTYGRGEDSVKKYRGDWTDLFRSRDLLHWEYVHRFYKNPHLDDGYPDETEDDMCPVFLPLPDRPRGGVLTGKWLQTFISHNKGGQYYIGSLSPDGETFFPEEHGRFSWKDNVCFAPEALMDGDNRQICWFWLRDNRKDEFKTAEWSGVYSFPRVFWYDGGLKMAPAEELAGLQYNKQTFTVGKTDGVVPLAIKNGRAFRLQATIWPNEAKTVGFRVLADADGREYTDILVDRNSGQLILDTTHSGPDGIPCREEAPFVLAEGEELSLDVFVDRSVVEVYANNRQALCRRSYPKNPITSDSVFVLAQKQSAGQADFGTVYVWEMADTNMY